MNRAQKGSCWMLLGLFVGAGLVPTSAVAQAVGNCGPALGEAFLNVNNVRARLLTRGHGHDFSSIPANFAVCISA